MARRARRKRAPRPRWRGGAVPRPAHQLHVGQVARRQLVVAALALEGQLLERPRADVRDRAQAPPRALVIALEVGPAGRHLAGGLDHRDRALAGQPAGLELGRRAARQPLGRGHVAQRAAGAAAPVAAHQAALDAEGPLGVDQLLADRPGQRLERLGAAPRAQPGPRADRGADQRIAPEAGVELGQVVIEAEREAHPLERGRRGVAPGRLGAQPHGRARGPDVHDHRLPARVQHALERLAAPPQHTVTPRTGQLVGAARHHLLLDNGEPSPVGVGGAGQRGGRGLASHRRQDRDRYLSIAQQVDVDQERARARDIHLLRPAARAAAHPEPRGPRAAQDANEHESGDADQKAAGSGGHDGRQRRRLGTLDRMGLGQDRQRPIVRLPLASRGAVLGRLRPVGRVYRRASAAACRAAATPGLPAPPDANGRGLVDRPRVHRLPLGDADVRGLPAGLGANRRVAGWLTPVRAARRDARTPGSA